MYFCGTSTEDANHDEEGGKDEETVELAPISENAGVSQHIREDIESKGYGTTDEPPIIVETPEPQSWTSFISNIVPTFTGDWTSDEKKETDEQKELGSTDESNLPELQSFIQPEYIPEKNHSDDGNKVSNNDSSYSSSPTKSRRGSVTTPEEKARRSKQYAAAYEELQQLFRTKARLFFKALHPPGLKVRGAKELTSPEMKILPFGTVFEVKNLGLTKRGNIL